MKVALPAAILFLIAAIGHAGPTTTPAAADERLVDQFGHRVGSAAFDGHWLLIFFGYSACPDQCPAALTQMRLLLDRLGRDGDAIQPVFVSVNPVHDTPARLKEFAARFHPRLRALTGSEAAVADAARTFGVPVRSGAKGGFDHGVFTYLVAPDGRVVAMLHPAQPLSDNLAQIRRALTAAKSPAAKVG